MELLVHVLVKLFSSTSVLGILLKVIHLILCQNSFIFTCHSNYMFQIHVHVFQNDRIKELQKNTPTIHTFLYIHMVFKITNMYMCHKNVKKLSKEIYCWGPI